MNDPQSVLPESVTGFSKPKPAAPATPQRQAVTIAAVIAVGVTLALAVALLRPTSAPMALESAPALAPTTAPTATPPPVIAVGFAPGARDQAIPAGAPVERLGPVELVNGETECYVQFQQARVWGACAALGFPDAARPTPVPPPPAPRPAAPAVPAWSQPAPVAPAAPPAELVPVSQQQQQNAPKPCTHPRCQP